MLQDWSKFRLSTILSGSDEHGTKYLKQFLSDVVKHLGVTVPNASCSKCLKDYHNRLISLSTKSEDMNKNRSQYKLLKKRNGIPLEFGSAVLVTNANITDEYAEILIKRYKKVNPNFKLEDLFEVYPENKPKKVEKIESEGSKSESDINTKENDLSSSDAKSEDVKPKPKLKPKKV